MSLLTFQLLIHFLYGTTTSTTPLNRERTSKLKYVDVSTNGFTEYSAGYLCRSLLQDITYVDLSRNRFTVGDSGDITQASKLEISKASSRGISGNLPPFTSCKSIEVIELDMNSLSGTVPESVAKCKALERMSLASNSTCERAACVCTCKTDISSCYVNGLDASSSRRSGRDVAKISKCNECGLIN
ncbi:hypothetical protein IFM89_031208 [Coptis chinensis]|uniref:Uncharacterized protein n=1 Tax=Coptis chinensis TaxID=261450 RepID=A0A835M7R5_9MAGN|nr:hypothetical protein IFM89_031208 [Coptis chinensis]